MSISPVGQQYPRPSIAPSPDAVARMKHDEIGKQHSKQQASTTEEFGKKPPPTDVAKRESQITREMASPKETPSAKVAANLQDATRNVEQEIRQQVSRYQQGESRRTQVIDAYEKIAKL